MIEDGKGGLIFPPHMNLIVIDNHNKTTLSPNMNDTNWAGPEAKRILSPLPGWYDFYKQEFCPIMRLWNCPMLVDSADGVHWGVENPEDFDEIAKTHRAYARIHAGAICITGLPFLVEHCELPSPHCEDKDIELVPSRS